MAHRFKTKNPKKSYVTKIKESLCGAFKIYARDGRKVLKATKQGLIDEFAPSEKTRKQLTLLKQEAKEAKEAYRSNKRGARKAPTSIINILHK